MSDAARAFISLLLCEAKQAEDRARSLRATAATIEAKNIEEQRKNRKRVRTFSQENHESVKKNTSSDEKKRERSRILTNQWGDLRDEAKQSWDSQAEDLSSQQQYKNDYHTESEHRDKKSK